ncbi:hypothetical protein D3C85_1922450 [compost metagenome]
MSVMYRTESGERYNKSIEGAPQGNYQAEHLTDVIEAAYEDLQALAHPNHVVAAA